VCVRTRIQRDGSERHSWLPARGGHIFTINRKPNRNFGFFGSSVRFRFFVSKKFGFRYRNRFSPYTEPKKPNTKLYQFSNLTIRLCELIV
jgi:hypothetical protein